MLSAFNVYSNINDFFSGFKMEKIIDPKFNYIDCFFIDEQKEKYIFVCKVFSEKYELFNEWEIAQDQDIALYIQNELFPRADIRWDIYFLLIYVGTEDLSIDEFHHIEKDRFCCKKYIIKARSKEELLENMNLKLPLTSKFYELDKLNNLITDDQFFEELRKKVNFNKEILSNRVLTDIFSSKNELIEKLKGD